MDTEELLTDLICFVAMKSGIKPEELSNALITQSKEHREYLVKFATSGLEASMKNMDFTGTLKDAISAVEKQFSKKNIKKTNKKK